MTACPARLEVIANSGQQKLVIQKNITTIGRSADNDLVLDHASISRYHARIDRTDAGYSITDLQSSNGTKVNQTLLAPGTPYALDSGALIHIGAVAMTFYQDQPIAAVPACPPNASPKPAPAEPVSALPVTQYGHYDPAALANLTGVGFTPAVLSLSHLDTLKIGRDPRNDLVIGHPSVSRFHARVERRQGSFVITDLGSSNGTYVNGKAITTSVTLRTGDTIHIGCDRLVLNIDETLTQLGEEGNLRLDALHLNKIVGQGTQILHDVSLSILPREFVAILGASGSGKSTLLGALNGLRPATGGTILVNGLDLYKNFQVYQTQIGYVPQKNIIHEELTIAQALNFAAQLRMPPDTTLAERRQRIQAVLNELGLSHRQHVPIQLLSGGQQRRVCIGTELLTEPSLFFLDEATSGLDPGTEADLMTLLRHLADRGRTILLITHATQNVHTCDLILYLAEGGRVAYFGPPDQMLDYFRDAFQVQFQDISVKDFSEIYRALDPEKNPNAPSPKALQQAYCQSPLYQRFVVNRQQGLGALTNPKLNPGSVKALPQPRQSRVSAWRQFTILSARNLVLFAQDKGNLLLTLGVAPLLGLMDFVTWKSDLFSLETGNATLAMIMLFVTALVAVMIGEMTTMRELVKEEEIYRRERIVGLQLIPYILSKVWIAVLLSAYQAAAFLLIKTLAVDIPGGWEGLLLMYATLTLAIIAGMMLGLLVSAIAPNQNMAPLLMIIVIVPQIIFSGGVQPLTSFGTPGRVINHLTVIKWPYEALVTVSGLGRDVAEDPCLQKTDAEREKLTDAQLQQCRCFGPRVFKACRFPGIKAKYISAVDQPKPVQPTEPGPIPQDPSQLQAYKDRVEAYQSALKAWQAEYQDWEKTRSRAIYEAEGLVKTIYKDQGYLFNVNVPRHWFFLMLLTVGMLVLIPLAQKRKDFF
jgi:ABC-type multidrug transport system ATPase subunit/pSer/pThr/pTyr-binding forkhead associated (FHA) protein